MTIPNKYLFAALLLSGALAAGASDNTQPELWDFQQCLDYASSHNIQLQQSQLTVESGKYDLEAAKAKWFPTLNFTTSHGYTIYPSPADGAKSNSYAGSYGLNAQWTLFDGGSRSNSIKRQQLQTESNNLTVEQLLANVPNAEEPGLLLGKIQCGKTDTFGNIIGIAFDRGIDIAIVLTKDKRTSYAC